jgi:hypothetical protein
VILVALGVRANTLLFVGAALACPLTMLFMMRGMAGGHGPCDRGSTDQHGEAAGRAPHHEQ